MKLELKEEFKDELRMDLVVQRGVSGETREKARKGTDEDTIRWCMANLGQQEKAKSIIDLLLTSNLADAVREHTEIIKENNQSNDRLNQRLFILSVVVAISSAISAFGVIYPILHAR